MKPFAFVSARNARHAVELLGTYSPAARIVAGGTDLLPELKSSSGGPDTIIDISRAADLSGISLTDEGLCIGAGTTHSELMRSDAVRQLCPALVDAAHAIGAVQTRNLGTIGGNLMSCIPCMDGGPVLLALEARATISGPGGERRVPLAELFVGPRRTSLGCDELLVDILIPKRNLAKPAGFLKFGLRKGQALALVNVAAAFWPEQNVFRGVSIALGAVAPTVMRAYRAEDFLEGAAITTAAMIEGGRIAAAEAKPINDFRASAGYRRHLIAVLTARALQAALARVEDRQAGEHSH